MKSLKRPKPRVKGNCRKTALFIKLNHFLECIHNGCYWAERPWLRDQATQICPMYTIKQVGGSSPCWWRELQKMCNSVHAKVHATSITVLKTDMNCYLQKLSEMFLMALLPNYIMQLLSFIFVFYYCSVIT